MGQKKLIRFAELETFKNVLQYPENMQGNWSEWFDNEGAIVLELACGKGEYAVGLGRMYPHKNFIGIDQKGNRLWVGAKQCIREGMNNVGFLRTQIDKINSYFRKDEVAEIWITFPDPQPSKSRKRLTSSRFLGHYRNIAAPAACINLKTDSDLFYESTLETIAEEKLNLLENVSDVYRFPCAPELKEIQTFYEKIWLKEGRTIKYLKFRLNPSD